MKTLTHAAVIAATLTGLAMVAPSAGATTGQTITVAPDAATTFANGGIGATDQVRMRQLASSYRLHLLFATKPDGAYLAKVPVTIRNRRGDTVFELSDGGPLLYVNLPAGDYQVTATLNGSTQTKPVTLHARGTRDVDFFWPEGTA